MTHPIRIAVIGTGNVGAPLGRRLGLAGYAVSFGARNPVAAAAKLNVAGAVVVSPTEAAATADVVLLTVPAAAAISTALELGLRPGTILIDCTNPIRWDNGAVWAPPAEGSMAAALAAALPGVRVIKAFSSFGAETHENPTVGGLKADVLIAGDDADAKATVVSLANALGYRGLDAGPLRNASLLENTTVLWIQLSGALGRDFAFVAVGR